MSTYKLVNKMLKSNYTRLNVPAKVTFAMTYACTFFCKTCNIGRNYLKNPKKIKENELSVEEIRKIFKSANFSWVQLTGGEPFLRTDIYEVIKAIKESCPDLYLIQTTTNGFITKNIVESVKKILTLNLPRFVVSISIDGLEEKHEELRGIKKAFQQAIETFRELQKLENKNFNVFISYTASPGNMGLLEETMNGLSRQYNIDSKYFHMNLFHTSDHYFTNINPENKNTYNQQVLQELRRMQKIKRGNEFIVNFLEKKYLKFAKDFIKTGKSPIPCKALNSSCFIDPYGNVYPCLIWNKNLGNLRNFDYDLRKIWQVQAVKDAQKIAHSLKCPNCWTPCEAYQALLGNLGKSIIK